jgi:hypothetical protein
MRCSLSRLLRSYLALQQGCLHFSPPTSVYFRRLMKTLPPLLLPFIQRPSPTLRSYLSAKPHFFALDVTNREIVL